MKFYVSLQLGTAALVPGISGLGRYSLPRASSMSHSTLLLVSEFYIFSGRKWLKSGCCKGFTKNLLGIPAAESGALAFFLMQPLGIIAEDLFKLALTPLLERFPLPKIVNRSLGALWVSLWMAWTVPWYMYPILEKGSGDDGVIPASIILYAKQLLK